VGELTAAALDGLGVARLDAAPPPCRGGPLDVELKVVFGRGLTEILAAVVARPPERGRLGVGSGDHRPAARPRPGWLCWLNVHQLTGATIRRPPNSLRRDRRRGRRDHDPAFQAADARASRRGLDGHPAPDVSPPDRARAAAACVEGEALTG
jgi:hypothetical protein